MKRIDFIKELQTIKKNFIAYAKDNSKEIDMNTFEINIGNGYLYLRIECNDSDDDCVVFTQEVVMDNENLYQNKLIPYSIETIY